MNDANSNQQPDKGVESFKNSENYETIQSYKRIEAQIEELLLKTKYEITTKLKKGIYNKTPGSFSLFKEEIENHHNRVNKLIDRILKDAYKEDDWRCINREFHDLSIDYIRDEFYYELCKLLCLRYEMENLNILDRGDLCLVI